MTKAARIIAVVVMVVGLLTLFAGALQLLFAFVWVNEEDLAEVATTPVAESRLFKGMTEFVFGLLLYLAAHAVDDLRVIKQQTQQGRS